MASVTLRFYGSLREYGSRFDVHADTAREALHLIISQIEGIKSRFIDKHFQLRVAKSDVNQSELEYYALKELRDGDVIHVVPRVLGAGGNAFGVIAGAALIAFSLTNPAGWAMLAVASTTLGSVAFSMGVALIIGGVAGMLTRQPKMTTGGTQEDGKNYSFNNLANVTQQGTSIPLCYGEITIGAQVISQGISSERLNKAPEAGEVKYKSGFMSLINAFDPKGNKYNTPENDKTYNLVEVK